MGDVKVISCEKDNQTNAYIVGLSNGDVDISTRQREIGSEWVPDEVLDAQERERAAATAGTKQGTDLAPRGASAEFNSARFIVHTETGEILKANGAVVESGKTLPQLVEDNAMLQRALDEANDTIEHLRRRLNLPIEIMDATPRTLDNMHKLEDLPPHPTMPAPETVAPTSDAQDVADHLERKRHASSEGSGS